MPEFFYLENSASTCMGTPRSTQKISPGTGAKIMRVCEH